MHPYWESKNCCSTWSGATCDSINQAQHGSCHIGAPRHHGKTDNRARNTGCKGSSVNSINSNLSSVKIESTCKTEWSSQPCSPPTDMRTWQQELQRAPQSVSTPSWTTSVDDGPFCRSCFASKHLTTPFKSHLPHLSATLINTRETSLPFIAIQPQWYPSNRSEWRSPPKFGSAPKTQHSLNPSNTHHTPQPRIQPAN